MRMKRILALLLAVVMVALAACAPIEDAVSRPTSETQENESTPSVLRASDLTAELDLTAWVQQILDTQNSHFQIVEIKAYYISPQQLEAYRISKNPSAEQIFGFRVDDISRAFALGSAISVMNNEVVAAATIAPTKHENAKLLDCEAMDWDRFFSTLTLGAGVIILTAVAVTAAGAPVTCALLSICKSALVEAITSYGSVALYKTVDGLLRGKTLAESVHEAMSNPRAVQAFADGFLMGALVGTVLSPFASTCFPAGTQVLTENGYQAIESIHPGNLVMSFDETCGEIRLSKVTETHKRTASELVSIDLSDGGQIEASPEHPFFRLNSNSWVSAASLVPGDTLMTHSGSSVTVTRAGYRRLSSDVDVYNLTVDGTHTYFVSGEASEAVLVHNTCAAYNDSHLYEIAPYDEINALRAKDSTQFAGLEAHHIPSKKYLEIFKEYGISDGDALTILIPKSTHTQTLSRSKWSVEKTNFYKSLSFEEVVQVDISNLRAVLRSEGITDPAVFAQVNKIEDTYRQMYPHLFN